MIAYLIQLIQKAHNKLAALDTYLSTKKRNVVVGVSIQTYAILPLVVSRESCTPDERVAGLPVESFGDLGFESLTVQRSRARTWIVVPPR